MIRAAAAIFVVSSVIAGCAVEGDDAPGADLQSTEAAATAARIYDCSGGLSDGDQLRRFEMTMSPTKVEITDLSKDALAPDSAKIDPTYRPTPAFAGAIRYSGFPKIVDSWPDVSTADLIVPKAFQDSPEQGKVLLRTSGPEGGGNLSYFCKTKAKKLAVDTAKRSRLACNLQLTCVHDNPPGDTCLDSAFVNQTSAGGATLRTTFLDHFGVHVQERKVENGASTDFDRTKETIKAKWEGHKLELKFRAGVTYLGTLTLPDGRKSTAQCNDLAMFD